MKEKKRAYVSVYNKDRIVEFCQYLVEYGYEIIATEGTCKVLRDAGIAALSAHELTGYPEPLGGKVRAMHPAVYSGIIANQLSPAQLKELGRAKAKVFPIELVVINLYPFREDMEAGVPFEEAATHIDVGGVALLDALKAVGIPAVEVHISDVAQREDFRQISYVRGACIGTVMGKGFDGYIEAMEMLIAHRGRSV